MSLPGEPTNDSNVPSFILASRLQPTSSATPSTAQSIPGVQQILLIPGVNKACVLCNGTLSFYSLPELSPAFGNAKVSNCTWVGRTDSDDGVYQQGDTGIVMICVKTRIRLVRISDKVEFIKNIEYPSCLASASRGRFACVADAHTYALVDIENQQKITLFPISSLDQAAGDSTSGQVQNISPAQVSSVGRSASSARPRLDLRGEDTRGHERSSSLGNLVGRLGRQRGDSGARTPERPALESPEPRRALSPLPATSPSRPISSLGSPSIRPVTPDKPLPPPPNELSPPKRGVPPASTQAIGILRPHISSPLSTEFLLTTGTSPDEPSVGMFVNLDGDVVRGTIEFHQYPGDIVLDNGDHASSGPTQGISDGESSGYVLASMVTPRGGGREAGIEIQRWDLEAGGTKEWLGLFEMPDNHGKLDSGSTLVKTVIGLGVTRSTTTFDFPEVGRKLRARRLGLSHPVGTAFANSPSDSQIARNQQEDDFASRLGHETCHIAVWSGDSIWWITKNPLILQLDAMIDLSLDECTKQSSDFSLDRDRMSQILDSIQSKEPRTETDFLTLGYVRQKISLIYFADVVNSLPSGEGQKGNVWQTTESLLIEGGIDPRALLSMVPLFQKDIVEGTKGIWIHEGLLEVIERNESSVAKKLGSTADLAVNNNNVFILLKRFLTTWRQRKGFGSISDETEVFQTVDAALLHVLLYQDQQNQSNLGGSSALRSDVLSLISSDVDCFTRAVDLLEEYRRLYVLSRLYHQRKMSSNVLATWRRIIDGEQDDGGEFVDGENEVRKYLIKLKDSALIEKYGTWLANRNPTLGVQVFSDDNSRVNFQPDQVVPLLRKHAPEAVKVYLEHLVFGKRNVQYANDLISYYLDNVLATLEASSDARATLSQSYESYRALQPPKPTYRQFITDNASPSPWWHDRLRLLELLGGSHGVGFSYDIQSILHRIEPFEQYLVPESIILDGRQARHTQALRLLTHGLGDYHTAINYCLLGGSSIFHPTSGPVDADAIPSREEQATLFAYLLYEFLRIQDVEDRLERTSELLERFGSWFDVAKVLEQIPDDWPVETVAGFLIRAFRRLVVGRSQTMITKALNGAENIKISAELVEKVEAIEPVVEVGEQGVV